MIYRPVLQSYKTNKTNKKRKGKALCLPKYKILICVNRAGRGIKKKGAQMKQNENGIELTITEQLHVIKNMCEVYCKFKEKETAGAISNRTFAEICKECPLSMI